MAITDKYVSATATGSGDGSSESSPWTLAQAVSSSSAGMRVNIKKGVYTLTTHLNTSFSGEVYRPILWRGYNTTPGDLDDKRTAAVGSTIEDEMPVIDCAGYYFILDGYLHNLIGLCFKQTSGTYYPALYDRRLYGWAKNCIWIMDDVNAARPACDCGSQKYRTYVNCEFRAKGDTSNKDDYAIEVTQSGVSFHYCLFNANGVSSTNTNSLVYAGAADITFNKCVFDGGSFQIYSNLNSFTAIDCVFHNAGDDAIHLIPTTTVANSAINGANIVNCYFSEVANYAIGNPSAGSLGLANAGVGVFNNAYYSVTNKFEHMPDTQEYDEVADTDAPFEDTSTGNFALISSSNANGYGMGNQIGLASKNFSDVGAIQRADPSPTTQPSAAGTQIYPFRQFVSDKFGAVLHPLRSN